MKKSKREFKKTARELEQYLIFKRRGFVVPAKKGKKCPYNRKEFKKGIDNSAEI